jgi:hypothetical protein
MHSHCNMCNISIYFCNTDMKHLQLYLWNICLQHALFSAQHLLATWEWRLVGVWSSPCRARRDWSSGEGCDGSGVSCHCSGGEGCPCGGEGHSRDAAEMEDGMWLRRAGGAMEMEEGGRPRSSVVEMSTGGHSESWRTARRPTECGHSAAEWKHPSVGSLLENKSVRMLERSLVGLVSRPANWSVRMPSAQHFKYNISIWNETFEF